MSAAAPAVPVATPLDVRNVLWLLAAMAFVMAPHVPRLPYWIAIFCGVILAWRAWISWSAWHFPNRWIIVAITIASTVGIWLTYRSIFGREAGVALLIIMSALKLLEMRTQREVTLSIYLGFFLVLTSFLFSQSMQMTRPSETGNPQEEHFWTRRIASGIASAMITCSADFVTCW